MQPATSHTCQKINWAYQTVSAIAHSLKNDTPANLRGTRTSPLILYRICQSCVLLHATQNLRYVLHPTQVQQVQSALISSLQRTLHCFTAAQITMLELGIPPLILRQAEQLVSLHFRYTVTHTLYFSRVTPLHNMMAHTHTLIHTRTHTLSFAGGDEARGGEGTCLACAGAKGGQRVILSVL